MAGASSADASLSRIDARCRIRTHVPEFDSTGPQGRATPREGAVSSSRRWELNSKSAVLVNLATTHANREGSAGARRTCEPHHHAAVHAPLARRESERDPFARA